MIELLNKESFEYTEDDWGMLYLYVKNIINLKGIF